ncbi:restriction endonuclease [Helicobacter pullorum]|uniref:site-specific DNA-methyltransferase n=1 Tax=Helicobacter pullorum TaxID=35818 RepID=UPI000816AD8E|nr:DNA methyltransferase [Helicobacter pullorum]OCR05149.1 restriction endonuclease [Helicobacter pullorum]
MDYKQAFLSQLENSYLGVQIQDAKDLFSQDSDSQYSGSKEALKKSGFINLLQMKSKYFQHIKTLLEKEKLNHSIYTKLYNFFSSYLNETGTPFFYDTPMHKNIYAKVYTNSKDTSLFYKTQNLYYVKSDTLYHDAEITSQDSKYTFIFDTSNFIPNADNAKNKAIFKFTIEENIRIYVLNDKESLKELPNVFKQNSGDLSDEFIKSLKDKKIQLQEEEIKKILSSYKRQNEIDFFIHKNARAFLQEQFNLWLCNYVLDDITQWRQEKIEELNTLKKVAFTIIDYIADFEDELKAIWCKPKFAKKVEYVFSLDRIDSALLDSIINDEGFKAQIKEWQELRLIDESFDIKNINDEKYKFLPLDTKHFSKTTKYKILSSFKDIESTLNGELIKSDNFQALNTLLPKYQNKVDLIYIDPPFNTGSDFEYKDKFQDSTWLTLMENRLELAKEFLSDRGSFYLHLDHNANYRGRELLNEVFGEENFRNEIVWHFRTYQGQVQDYFPRKHNLIYWYTKNNQTKDNFFEISYSNNFEDTVDYKRWKEFLVNENEIRYPNYPKTDSRFEGYLNRYLKSVEKPLDGDLICKINGYVVDDVWIDIQAIDPKAKAERMESNTNLTQKPEALLQRIIKASSNEDSIVFDYHLGSGTTLATAHKLGRKWLGVEMGEHFYKVIIPRMKKVIGGFVSGISKEVEFKGGGAFRYYELESYEESLEQCEYVLDKDSIIDYRKSRKLIKALNKDEAINLDMSGYRENFDILHTMANVLGLRIQRLFLDSKGIECVEFDNGGIVSSDNVDLCKYPKLTKLIWWER